MRISDCLKVGAAVFALALATQTPRMASADLNIPLPDVTVAPSPSLPTHVPVYIKLTGDSGGKNSCWHVNDADAFNGACARPGGGSGQPTAGPGGTAADMVALGKYATMIETNNGGGDDWIGLAGQLVLYQDIGFIHTAQSKYIGTGTAGSMPAAGTFTNACLDTLPPYVGLQARNYGQIVYAPNNATGTCNSVNQGSILGDVNPMARNYWANSIEIAVHKQLNGLGGFSGAAGGKTQSAGFKIVRWDDHDYPANRFSQQALCRVNYNATAGSGLNGIGATCAAMGRAGTDVSRADNQYFTYKTYPGYVDYMDPGWVAGSQELFRMPGRFGMKSIFNDAVDPSHTVYSRAADRANLLGAQCEGCITRNGYASNVLWDVNTWLNHLNTEVVLNAQKVAFMIFNPSILSIADDVYLHASAYLAMGYPQGIVMTGDGFGATNSTVGISPLDWMYPTEPSNDPAKLVFDPFRENYNRIAPPRNVGVGTLQVAGGGFVRKFNHYYIGNSGVPRDLGVGYAIAFPQAGTFPTGITGVTYQWSFTGSGIIADTQFGGGDTGVPVATASIPAAGAAVSAGTGYILTANN